VLGQPVAKRPECQVDELAKRHGSARTGPEGDAGAEHAGRHGGKQPRIRIPFRVGAEPLSKPVDHGSLEQSHLRRVGYAQVRVGACLPHAPQPVHRVAAEFAQLIGHRLGIADHHRPECVQRGLARRLMGDPLPQRGDPVRVRVKQRGFLGCEVVEERARRHFRRLGYVLDGDVREAALGHQVKCRPA
jgi:hypothetical protein